MFHYWCLYDTLIKIPLIIKFPQAIGINRKIDKVVQNVDILPTILGILENGDQDNFEHLQGNDLLGVIEPRRPAEIAISELVKTFGPDRFSLRDRFERFDRRLVSVRTQRRKFIFSSRNDHECYDLEADPGELANLYPKADGFTDLMRYAEYYYQQMDEFYQKNRDKIESNAGTDAIDPKVMENLKSLGYM
jgi:arylsulfatase A-like enzyme